MEDPSTNVMETSTQLPQSWKARLLEVNPEDAPRKLRVSEAVCLSLQEGSDVLYYKHGQYDSDRLQICQIRKK